jgi:hypothetical protein
MAAKTKSDEVREQWLTLANSWLMKAQATEGFLRPTQHRELFRQPTITQAELPVVEKVVSVVPEESLAVSSASAADAAAMTIIPHQVRDAPPVDEFWTNMIAEIRGR